MSAYLDDRFRLLPSEGRCAEEVVFDFHAAAGPGRHAVARPRGGGRPFYEMPGGETRYFEDTDEVYLGFGDGVRALYEPGMNRVSVSSVESESRNLFAASHLVLTILLVEIFKRRGWYSLHAAGFSENGRAILIPGTSGAGKSTLSVALLRAKFDYLSDDMVFLGGRPEDLTARGIVEDVDVSDQTIGFFPELNFLLQSPRAVGLRKRRVRVEEVYRTRAIAESHPHAIIFPRISGSPSSVITPVGSDQALLEIVPNVLLTQPRACQAHLAVLAGLAKQAACYRLDTGRDFDRIPAIFRAVLSGDREKVCA
ncbi:MAG TPA: hypothetical protein VNJ52_05230 [Patescibacteria group bacterium]|nr:hypothetical protein [Patescibacteria group bacterium]